MLLEAVSITFSITFETDSLNLGSTSNLPIYQPLYRALLAGCLSLPDSDLFDEDSRASRSSPPLTRDMYSEEGHPRPQRRERTKFNRIQSLELEKEFQKNPYPGIQRRVQLACKLAIDESRIQVTAIPITSTSPHRLLSYSV